MKPNDFALGNLLIREMSKARGESLSGWTAEEILREYRRLAAGATYCSCASCDAFYGTLLRVGNEVVRGSLPTTTQTNYASITDREDLMK